MKYNFCKNCGSPVQPGMTNCQRCGAPVDQVQPVDEDKPMAQPPGMLRQYIDGSGQPNSNVAQAAPQQPMNNGQPMMNNQPMNQGMGNPMPQQQPMMNQQPPMNNNMQPPMNGPMNNMGQPVQGQNTADTGSIGWGILGFIIPLVGWILYFVWKDSKPKSAKVAGLGGLIGFGLNMILYFTGILKITI